MDDEPEEYVFPIQYPFYGPDFARAEVQGIEELMQKAQSLDYASLLRLLRSEQDSHEGFHKTWTLATEFVFHKCPKPFPDLSADASVALAAYSVDTPYYLWREFNRECREAMAGSWPHFPFKSLLSLMVEVFRQTPQPWSLPRALFRMQQEVDLRHEGDFYPLRQFTTAHVDGAVLPRRGRSMLVFQNVEPRAARYAAWYPGFRTFDLLLHPRSVFYVRRVENSLYGMPNVVLEFFG